MTEVPTFSLGNIGHVYPSDMAELAEAMKSYMGRQKSE